MAFANSNVTDLIATGIESRTREIADNVTKNNAVLAQLEKKGRIKTFDGGTKILQELSFQENPNVTSYSGYDVLPVNAADVLSAAEYKIAQYAAPVTVSGLETIQNSGRERLINLIDERITVARNSLRNRFSNDLWNSDGTGNSGKNLDGLAAAIPTTAQASQTDTYGNISRSTYSFWRTYTLTGQTINSATTVQTVMNQMWGNLIRGADRPDLILMDFNFWKNFVASLQAIQRFTNPGTADLGFRTLQFMDADVVLDSGIGGYAPTGTALFLNTDYLMWRPYQGRNFTTLDPTRRWSVNQDAEVQIIAWAGNLTTSGAQFQGRCIASVY